MSGVWHRTLVYLGLKEEPEEGYDDLPERLTPEPADEVNDSARVPAGAPAPAGTSPSEDPVVRHLRTGDVHVRAVPSTLARAAVVEVREFDDVEAVAARYRTGQAVLFDLSAADAVVGRRVVDFVSGVTYALRGTLTKVGGRAFLVVPDGVELAQDELHRLEALGYRLPTGSDA